MRRSILFLSMSTLRTHLRGIARVNVDHPYRPSFSLVLGKGLKLSEAPTVESPSLLLPSLFNLTLNPGQLLKNKSCPWFYRLNQLFGKYMVTIPSETFLSTRELLQASLSRLRAFRLEPSSMLKYPILNYFPVLRTIKGSIGISSWFNNSQIYTNNFFGWLRDWNVFGDNYMEPPTVLLVSDQISTGRFPSSVFTVKFWDFNWKLDSSLQSQKGDFQTIKPDRVRSISVAYRAKLRARARDFFTLPFKLFNSFQNLCSSDPSRACQFRREFIFIPVVVVGCMMEVNAIRLPSLKAILESVYAFTVEIKTVSSIALGNKRIRIVLLTSMFL